MNSVSQVQILQKVFKFPFLANALRNGVYPSLFPPTIPGMSKIVEKTELSNFNRVTLSGRKSSEFKTKGMLFRHICSKLVHHFIVISSSQKVKWLYTSLHH